ncbi:MAG: N-acetylneuraminate synthase family protein [Parcubacteria group bacterium]|nr:N-acetylneuraminate synthase family protein [Parcubacteria group bacterium]
MAHNPTFPGLSKTLDSDGVFVIAEIGKNFIQSEDDRTVEEYLENAKALVDAAVNSGADAVKFQTHELEDEFLQHITVVSPHFKGSDRVRWITRNMNATPLETFWKPLQKHCEERGIIFFSTPMSRKAAHKLEELNVPLWKVGSGDVEDYATLDFLISTGKPIIISTGMVSLGELDDIVKYIRGKGSELAVLYCISQYPAPKEYFNLSTIEYMKEKYPDVIIGFSDHSLGYDVALAAVKLGARVVEKHFSLSRDLWGSDHKVSMTPEEFRAMVDIIRSGEYKDVDHLAYYGDKEKELEGAKNMFRPYFNKALMAGQDIPEGTVITKETVFAMRPFMHAGGLPSKRFYDVVGKRTKVAFKKYDPITEDSLYV